MNLVQDWKQILLKAWSVWGIVFHAIVNAMYLVWPAFQDRIPLPWFVAGSFIICLLLIVLRLMKQDGLNGE